jgi:hypothetical protein
MNESLCHIGTVLLTFLLAGRIIVKLVGILSISTGDWLIQCYVPLGHWGLRPGGLLSASSNYSPVRSGNMDVKKCQPLHMAVNSPCNPIVNK